MGGERPNNACVKCQRKYLCYSDCGKKYLLEEGKLEHSPQTGLNWITSRTQRSRIRVIQHESWATQKRMLLRACEVGEAICFTAAHSWKGWNDHSKVKCHMTSHRRDYLLYYYLLGQRKWHSEISKVHNEVMDWSQPFFGSVGRTHMAALGNQNIMLLL